MFENTIDKDQKNKIIRILMRIFSNEGVKRESAVSPVVGIMLMITITLILAAIISGMTGGIAQSQKKPPQLLFEAEMVNSGITDKTSFFDIRVLSVSEGIPTKDLKLITEWRDDEIHRNVTIPFIKNDLDKENTYPLGYTPGNDPSDFGNYILLAGTRLNVNGSEKEAMNAVLDDWDKISDGIPIKIQFVHVPSGAIVAEKEITAEG